MLPFIVFVGLPIAEIVLLVKAGDAFGFWWTVGWIFASGAVGLVLVRQQGLAAIARAQQVQAAGEVPVGAILTGIRLAFAGVLMIVPGFITDAFGLLLLLPWTGNTLGRTMAARVQIRPNWMAGDGHDSRGGSDDRDNRGGETIDADFEVIDPDTPCPDRLSGPDTTEQPPMRRNGNPWQKS